MCSADLHKTNHWKYKINCSGFNYRLSDINAALGLSQLTKINKFINYRKKVYDFYSKELKVFKNLLNFPKYNNIENSSYIIAVLNYYWQFLDTLYYKNYVRVLFYKPMNKCP